MILNPIIHSYGIILSLTFQVNELYIMIFFFTELSITSI